MSEESTTPARSTIIDVWMQHPTLRFLAHDMFASLRRWTGQEVPDQAPAVEASLASMDSAGVNLGLLSAWSAPHQPDLISNDQIAGWVDEHAGRFAGLACVDLNKPMDAVRELRRCVTELGFKGLRVVSWLWEAPPTDRRYYPLYATCVELNVPREAVGSGGGESRLRAFLDRGEALRARPSRGQVPVSGVRPRSAGGASRRARGMAVQSRLGLSEWWPGHGAAWVAAGIRASRRLALRMLYPS